MSVSSHLTPEPERRLWLILENIRHEVERAEGKILAVTFLAAVEVAFIKGAMGPLLGAALVAGVYALTPWAKRGKGLSWLDGAPAKQRGDDSLIAPADIVKYAHGELILKLDKYLGGGITATQYYEDIVGSILSEARLAVRKERLLRAVCVLVLLGQVVLAWEKLIG